MIELHFPEWPTHVAISDNKKAPNKFIKVNNQSIYSGAIARFGRNRAVKNLHKYFCRHIPNNTTIDSTEYPIKVKYVIKTVLNHGDIQRRNGNIVWKYTKEGYLPDWDIENLASILIKTGNDSLVQKKVIRDDSVQYINNIEYEFQPVDNLEEREIIIKLGVEEEFTKEEVKKLVKEASEAAFYAARDIQEEFGEDEELLYSNQTYDAFEDYYNSIRYD